MRTEILSEELKRSLEGNKYVDHLTLCKIIYTAEFKQLAYDRLMAGVPIKQIFEEAGFDCDLLGTSRIGNMRRHILYQGKRGENFEDKRSKNGTTSPENYTAQLEKKIKALEHRNLYLQQENDFLKKIQSVEKAFRKKEGVST